MAKEISFNPKFSQSQKRQQQNDREMEQQPITIQINSLEGVQSIEEEKNQQIMQKLVDLMPPKQSLDSHSVGSESHRDDINLSHRQNEQKTDFYNNRHRASSSIELEDSSSEELESCRQGKTSEEDDRFVELHVQSQYTRSASNLDHSGQEIVMRDNLIQETSPLQKSNTQEIREEDEESLAYIKYHNQDNQSQQLHNNNERRASIESKNKPYINIDDEDQYNTGGPQNSYRINNKPQKHAQTNMMQNLQPQQNLQYPKTRLTVLTEEKTDYADKSSAQSYRTSSVSESEQKNMHRKNRLESVPIIIQNQSKDDDISKLEHMISDTSQDNNSSSQSFTENSNDKSNYP